MSQWSHTLVSFCRQGQTNSDSKGHINCPTVMTDFNGRSDDKSSRQLSIYVLELSVQLPTISWSMYDTVAEKLGYKKLCDKNVTDTHSSNIWPHLKGMGCLNTSSL